MEDYQREFLMEHISSYILLDELTKKIDHLCATTEMETDVLMRLQAEESELSDAVDQQRKDSEKNVVRFTEMFDEDAVESVLINAYDTFRECVGSEGFDGYMIDQFVYAIVNKSEDHCRDLYNSERGETK